MSNLAEPLQRLEFDTQRLMAEHPPIWRHRNKQAVFEIASPLGCVHSGRILYSRWSAMALPESMDAAASTRRLDVRQSHYDYVPVLGGPDAVEWHVNFADPHLFVAYGSALFAQDEMQAAEHPALGAVREALDEGGHTALTVENGQPTPVLVMGVERRCRIATDRNAAEGRPDGLYGNAFARASTDVVRRTTSRIDPPTITNIIAMAAPSGGYGRYSGSTIEKILFTACSGFRAATLAAAEHRGRVASVAVHTGFWGCGAFGGHRVLMAMLQVLAAEMAGLDRLIFHAFDSVGTRAVNTARAVIERDLASRSAVDTRVLIDRIAAMGFEWGVSDGN